MSRLEQDQRVQLVLGRLGRLLVLLLLRCRELLLRRLVALHQPVRDGLQGRDQLALLGLRVQLHGHHAIHLEVIVVPGGVQLGAQVEDEVRVGDAASSAVV